MSFREKALKIGSTIFMAFIVAIIVIAFGMPDFITTAAQSRRNLVGRVDNLNIYPSDIGQQKQALQAQFGGENLPPALMSLIESQALERAIQQKLFFILARDSHLVPKGDARIKALANFYRENLSSFMKDGKFDFNSFEKTLLRQNRTRVEFENSVIEQISMDKLRQLLYAFNFTSLYDAVENQRLQKSLFSLRLIVLDSAAKEKWLRANVKISESEIQERFKQEYLSKDPKDKLTTLKREAIVNQLFNEKKPALEQELMSKLNQMSKLKDVALLTGLKPIELTDIALNQSLESKKPKEAPSLVSLERSETYLFSLFRAKPGEMFQVTTDAATYFVEITKREMSTLPKVASLKEAHGNLEVLVKEENLRKAVTSDTSGNQHWNQTFETVMELMKKYTTIKRFREQSS